VYALQLDPEPDEGTYLVGVGGANRAIRLATALLFPTGAGTSDPMNGIYYAFTDPISLDFSVLGRDVLGRFAVIVDRPQQLVTLLAGNHRYQVVAS